MYCRFAPTALYTLPCLPAPNRSDFKTTARDTFWRGLDRTRPVGVGSSDKSELGVFVDLALGLDLGLDLDLDLDLGLGVGLGLGLDLGLGVGLGVRGGVFRDFLAAVVKYVTVDLDRGLNWTTMVVYLM